MSIDVTCPQGHKLRIAEKFAGATIRCPKCSQAVEVPHFEIEVGSDSEDELGFSDEDLKPPPRKPEKSRKKEAAAPAPAKQAPDAAGGVQLTGTQLGMIGGGWLLSLLVAGFIGAQFGGGGGGRDVGKANSQSSVADTKSQPPAGSAETSSATDPTTKPSIKQPSVPQTASTSTVSSSNGSSPAGIEGVRRDLTAGIDYLDKKQYRIFIHEVTPELERQVDRDPKALSDSTLINELNGLKMHFAGAIKGKSTFNRDESFVELEYELLPDEKLEAEKPEGVPPLFTKPAKPVEGFGADLTLAVRDASELLRTVKFDDPEVPFKSIEQDKLTALYQFFERIYPLAEVARLQAGDNMQRLVARLAGHTPMIKAMQSDLALMSADIPNLDSSGTVATWKVRSATAGGRERLIKMEKVEGHWRFFDNAKSYREESHKLASAPFAPFTLPGTRGSMTLIKIGDRWTLKGNPRVISNAGTGPPASGFPAGRARAVPATGVVPERSQ